MSDPTTTLANEPIELILDFCEHTTVMCVAQICQRWRMCARAHGQYYINLKFDVPVGTIIPDQQAYEKIFRDLHKVTSVAVPVSLSLTLDVIFDGHVSDVETIVPPYTDIWTKLGQYINTVLPVSKHLYIFSASTIFIDILLKACNKPAQMLESLFITHSAFRGAHPEISCSFLGDSAPRLHYVVLCDVTLPPDHFPVAAFSAVQILHLTFHEGSCIDLRAHTPQLQALHLRLCSDLSPNIGLPVTLHTLFISLPPIFLHQSFPEVVDVPLENVHRHISTSEMHEIGVTTDRVRYFGPEYLCRCLVV